jgi:hypothetical protein
MHMGIAIITYGEDADEATEKAKDIADMLCEKQDPFDYHADYPPTNDGELSGMNFSKSLPVADVRVKTILNNFMEYTKDDFLNYVEKVRTAMNGKTAEELWELKDDMWRFYAYEVGKYKGSSIHIYDNDGEGIRNDAHLQNALDKWQTAGYGKNYEGMNVYVYFQDVHF